MRKSVYDPFEHLCRSLFVKRNEVFAMITAYFDDSGTDAETQVCSVGGYLATVDQWNRFIPRWQELLSEYDVQQMHRTDLETWHGEFTKDRGWEPTRRKNFLKKAHRIIKDFTYTPIGSAVVKKDFEDILPEPIKKFFGGEYGWCAHECILAVSNWSDRAKHHEPIEWIFEEGTKGSGQIIYYLQRCSETPTISQMTRVKRNGWSFKSKAIIPLQAADVVAYEIYKQVQNQIVGKGEHAIRLSALDLWPERYRNYMKYWDRDRLLKWLNEPALQRFIQMITRHQLARDRNAAKTI